MLSGESSPILALNNEKERGERSHLVCLYMRDERDRQAVDVTRLTSFFFLISSPSLFCVRPPFLHGFGWREMISFLKVDMDIITGEQTVQSVHVSMPKHNEYNKQRNKQKDRTAKKK